MDTSNFSDSDTSSEDNLSVEIFDVIDEDNIDNELMGDNQTLSADATGTQPYLFEPVLDIDEDMTIEIEDEVEPEDEHANNEQNDNSRRLDKDAWCVLNY